MGTAADEVAHTLSNLSNYLAEHRQRMTYQQLRRGGYPLGRKGIESASLFTHALHRHWLKGPVPCLRWAARVVSVLGGRGARHGHRARERRQ